jgi:hypothetical protein
VITITLEISDSATVASAVSDLLAAFSGVTSSSLVGIGATVEDDEDELTAAIDSSDS